MSATGRSDVRVESDYYPTPAWCVHRLLEAVRLPGGAWLDPTPEIRVLATTPKSERCGR